MDTAFTALIADEIFEHVIKRSHGPVPSVSHILTRKDEACDENNDHDTMHNGRISDTAQSVISDLTESMLILTPRGRLNPPKRQKHFQPPNISDTHSFSHTHLLL